MDNGYAERIEIQLARIADALERQNVLTMIVGGMVAPGLQSQAMTNDVGRLSLAPVKAQSDANPPPKTPAIVSR
jgi:hypothetical protein